jgi:hypothetical protein
MSSHVAGFAGRSTRPAGVWERCAHWVAPLLAGGVFALATYLMYANCGAALI